MSEPLPTPAPLDLDAIERALATRDVLWWTGAGNIHDARSVVVDLVAEVRRLGNALRASEQRHAADSEVWTEERDRLRVAIRAVLDDAESRPGGWGPDVTALAALRAALGEVTE